MIRRPPRATRTDTLCPYTTPFRSGRSYAWNRLDADAARRWVRVSGTPPWHGEGASSLRHKAGDVLAHRSEEHTSELQSLMRISYAVFCLTKNTYHIAQQILANNQLYTSNTTHK